MVIFNKKKFIKLSNDFGNACIDLLKFKNIICSVCKRKIPNIEFSTKKGCVWCDSEFHQKEKKNG